MQQLVRSIPLVTFSRRHLVHTLFIRQSEVGKRVTDFASTVIVGRDWLPDITDIVSVEDHQDFDVTATNRSRNDLQ